MKMIFATGNTNKLREVGEILGDTFELFTPAQYGITEEIPETGNSLAENSLQKAMYIWQRTGLSCFADDTGLEVDALGGAPGIYTARYAGPQHDSNANMDKILAELANCGQGAVRTARFRTVVTLILNAEVLYFNGVLEGKISNKKSGKGGFGYDPIFIPDDFPSQTLSEISEEEKNRISHRGKAIREMASFLLTK